MRRTTASDGRDNGALLRFRKRAWPAVRLKVCEGCVEDSWDMRACAQQSVHRHTAAYSGRGVSRVLTAVRAARP